MLIMTGNGRLTRTPKLRQTQTGKAVTTVSVASDRRDRSADPVFVELILWNAQAEAAVKHLVKGQAIAFTGRFEPRSYEARDGHDGVALELTNVDIEYGAKPRSTATPAAEEQAA